jgi:hypothetical protein
MVAIRFKWGVRPVVDLQAALRSAGSVLRSLAVGHPLLILPAPLRLIVRSESVYRGLGVCIVRIDCSKADRDKGVCCKW